MRLTRDPTVLVKAIGLEALFLANFVLAIRVLGGNRGVWGFLWRAMGLLMLSGYTGRSLAGGGNPLVHAAVYGGSAWLFAWILFEYWPYKLPLFGRSASPPRDP